MSKFRIFLNFFSKKAATTFERNRRSHVKKVEILHRISLNLIHKINECINSINTLQNETNTSICSLFNEHLVRPSKVRDLQRRLSARNLKKEVPTSSSEVIYDVPGPIKRVINFEPPQYENIRIEDSTLNRGEFRSL